MFETLHTWVHSIWAWFDKTGPLANFIQIGSGAAAAYFFFRTVLSHKDGQIRDLKRDLEDRQKVLDTARVKVDRLEKEKQDLIGRMPATALDSAEKERRDGNDQLADRELRLWLEQEGETVSRILLDRAEWVIARSIGEYRAAGLSIADVFTNAALALFPKNSDALELSKEISALRLAEAQFIQSPADALNAMAALDELPSFDANDVESALESLSEANRLWQKGLYHLALPIIDRAIKLFSNQIGRNALPTLRSRVLRSQILYHLGRSHETIADITATAKIMEEMLGPEHSDTIDCKRILAYALASMGHADKALPIVVDVVERSESSHTLGPTHPITLSNRHLLAIVLVELGQNAAALEIISDVAEKHANHPAIGTTHPDSLASRYMHAQILDNLGRSADALRVAEFVSNACANNSQLGPTHPNTLASQHSLALVLFHLGRTSEALPIIAKVAEFQMANPAIGPTNIYTVTSCTLLARALNVEGRASEALSIIEDTIKRCEGIPTLHLLHPYILERSHVHAEILHRLGRSHEALSIIRDAGIKRRDSPSHGPTHPATLRSQYLLARILNELGRPADALPIIADVVDKQLANSSIGPTHRDTNASKDLLIGIRRSLNRET